MKVNKVKIVNREDTKLKFEIVEGKVLHSCNEVCKDLHVVTEHGLVKVNFILGDVRKSFFYPVDTLETVITES